MHTFRSQATPGTNTKEKSLTTQETNSETQTQFVVTIDLQTLRIVAWSPNLPLIARLSEQQLAGVAVTELFDDSVLKIVHTLVANPPVATAENGLSEQRPSRGAAFEFQLRTRLLPHSQPCWLTKIAAFDDRKLQLYLRVHRADELDHGTSVMQALAAALGRASVQSLAVASVEEFLSVAAQAVQNLTGFDHVVAWHQSASGEMTAVAQCNKWLSNEYELALFPPFVLQPAVELRFVQDRLRLVVLDEQKRLVVDGESELIPGEFDQMSRLGAHASLTIALVHGSKVHSLLACYSQQCREVSAAERTAWELLGNYLDLQMTVVREQVAQRDKIRRFKMVEDATRCVASANSFAEGIRVGHESIMGAAAARGVAYVENGQVMSYGAVPECAVVNQLLEIAPRGGGEYWTSLTAHAELPLTVQCKMPAEEEGAGEMFLMDLGSNRQQEILLFRPESRQPPSCGEGDILAALRFALTTVNVAGSSIRLSSELQRLNSDLNTFAYSISHDLRQPLRAANQALFFLEKALPESQSDAISSRLGQLRQSHKHMAELMNAVLRLSRVDQANLHVEKVQLSEVIDQAAEVAIGYHPPEHCQLTVTTSATGWADFICLREVFVNLFSNAVRYNRSPRKEITVGSIRLSSDSGLNCPNSWPASENGRTVFYCRDNGIGIAEEHLQEVFDLFRRFPPADLEYSDSTGAGLAIVKRIVERHGGKVWIESELGEGTTVYFTLGGDEDQHVEACSVPNLCSIAQSTD
jgi:two-component system, chemotaxis family, sensor kinase Cph1